MSTSKSACGNTCISLVEFDDIVFMPLFYTCSSLCCVQNGRHCCLACCWHRAAERSNNCHSGEMDPTGNQVGCQKFDYHSVVIIWIPFINRSCRWSLQVKWQDSDSAYFTAARMFWREQSVHFRTGSIGLWYHPRKSHEASPLINSSAIRLGSNHLVAKRVYVYSTR